MKKLLLVLAAPVILAAQPAAMFETASIKPIDPGGQCPQSMIQPMTGGGLRVECLALKVLIMWSYQVQDYQLSGGPGWVESTRWDIQAKGPSVPGAIEYEKMTDEQRGQSMELVRRRLQALLAERFHLTLRRESREQPVYALTVAKIGKLKESEDQAKSGMLRRGRGLLISKGSQMPAVAQFLAVDLGRPVVDRTGLTAHYDFEIHWTPEGRAAAEASEPGPTLFTAIQELGLKLEPAKAPVEMLVIERVEKPTDN